MLKCLKQIVVVYLIQISWTFWAFNYTKTPITPALRDTFLFLGFIASLTIVLIFKYFFLSWQIFFSQK